MIKQIWFYKKKKKKILKFIKIQALLATNLFYAVKITVISFFLKYILNLKYKIIKA